MHSGLLSFWASPMLGGPVFQAQLLSTEACSLSRAPVLTTHWGAGGVPKDSLSPLPRGNWCGVAQRAFCPPTTNFAGWDKSHLLSDGDWRVRKRQCEGQGRSLSSSQSGLLGTHCVQELQFQFWALPGPSSADRASCHPLPGRESRLHSGFGCSFLSKPVTATV